MMIIIISMQNSIPDKNSNISHTKVNFKLVSEINEGEIFVYNAFFLQQTFLNKLFSLQEKRGFLEKQRIVYYFVSCHPEYIDVLYKQ